MSWLASRSDTSPKVHVETEDACALRVRLCIKHIVGKYVAGTELCEDSDGAWVHSATGITNFCDTWRRDLVDKPKFYCFLSGYALVEKNLRHIHSWDLFPRLNVSQHAASNCSTRNRCVETVSRNESSGLKRTFMRAASDRLFFCFRMLFTLRQMHILCWKNFQFLSPN